ncbi:unnamed protein product [Anisakis simplex]|uniref:Secreted protein n=1 Tax=Anisakis simplex TaxID=6269 RepID=A0A0M3JTC0_ANISI|nr:unnamed protein product [Anisakis simplex]
MKSGRVLKISVVWLITVEQCFLKYALAQYTSQTYPDPRIDPFSCHIPFLGLICDPSDILLPNEKGDLINKINQLLTLTSQVHNTAPACQSFPGKNLEILIAVIDKIGTIPIVPVDIEKFANNLKSRYQNYQDVTFCDTTVLIVNSRSDRQVFTVAGRDTRLTKQLLSEAFSQNVAHFKAHQFAKGLEGMAKLIASAYGKAHNGEFVMPETLEKTLVNLLHEPPTDLPPPVIANGIRQTTDNLQIESSSNLPSINTNIPPVVVDSGISITDQTDEKKESEQLWIDVLKQAVARCGDNQDMIGKYTQSIVEDAMSLSLRLIKDKYYNSIEENISKNGDNLESHSDAWSKARHEFLDDIYRRNTLAIRADTSDRCPLRSDNLRAVTKFWNRF